MCLLGALGFAAISVVQLRLKGPKSQAQQRKLSVTVGQAFQVAFEGKDLQCHVEVPCSKEKSVLGLIKFFQGSGHLDFFLQFGLMSIFPASGPSLCNSQHKHISTDYKSTNRDLN